MLMYMLIFYPLSVIVQVSVLFLVTVIPRYLQVVFISKDFYGEHLCPSILPVMYTGSRFWEGQGL